MARLVQGHKTTLTFSADASVLFFPRLITPPGWDGGDAIETTVLAATAYRMFEPRTLKTLTEMTIEATYDPGTYTEMIAMVNVNQLVTLTWPDLSTLAFYGFIRAFTPGAL